MMANKPANQSSVKSSQAKEGRLAFYKALLLPFLQKHFVTIAFLLAVSACALALRICTYPDESWDYTAFLSKWYKMLKENGGFRGISKAYEGTAPSDYCPSYLYLLAFITYLPVNPLYAIKTVSVVFDFVLAVFVGLTIRQASKKEMGFSLGYACALLLPNVFLNSAVWGQCDVIYTCFIVISFYYLLKGKGIPSMVFFGLAFSFKLQAIFFLPVIVVAVWKKKIEWQTPAFAIIPYFLMGLPALMMGVSVIHAYGIYFVQMGEYADLTLNAPNLYTWIAELSEANTADLARGMTFGAIGMTGIALLPLLQSKYRADCDDLWIAMAAFFAAFIPFVLPHMHERYFYMADIFALIFVLRNPKKWYVGAACILPSLFVVMKYLYFTHQEIIKLAIVAVVMLGGVCMLGAELFKAVQSNLLPQEGEEPTQVR